ncbi:hypothetical protein ACHAWC_007933 [Mediolabrus comicus]
MNDTSISFPHRNIDRLYCPCITYLCAIGKHQSSEGQKKTSQPCIPCAYKVACFDIALDKEFTKLVPNQRPEVCPRSAANTKTNASNDDDYDSNNNIDGIMGYRRGMNVLTVGDGDFSFSLAVAKLVASADNDSGGMVVATSYEDKPTLQRVYPAFEDTLNSLQNCDTKTIVGYNVDATQLNQTLPSDVLQSNVKYHRICWNFPCTAIGNGQDGQNDAMEENKELVRKFMVNALPYLDKDCGEIHIAHKTKPPYNQWQMEKNGNENFEYKGRLVFDKQLLPPYTPRKALDRKSFPCHDACIYIFGFRRTSDEESTIPCAEDVDNDELSIQQLAQLGPSSVIPVTTQLINNVRSIHMKLAVYRQEELKQRSKKRSGNEHQGRKKQRRRK